VEAPFFADSVLPPFFFAFVALSFTVLNFFFLTAFFFGTVEVSSSSFDSSDTPCLADRHVGSSKFGRLEMQTGLVAMNDDAKFEQ
jgi:hypothetical protein